MGVGVLLEGVRGGWALRIVVRDEPLGNWGYYRVCYHINEARNKEGGL